MNTRTVIGIVVGMAVGAAAGSWVTWQVAEVGDSAAVHKLNEVIQQYVELEEHTALLEERNEYLEGLPVASQEEETNGTVREDLPEFYGELRPDSPPPDVAEALPAQEEDTQVAENDSAAAERQQRRDAFRAAINQRIAQRHAFMAETMEQTPDPEARGRIAAIQEHEAYLLELRGALREAQTDEQRDAIRDAMRQNWQTLNTLRDEQENVMLRELAARYGIENPDQQQAFVESYHQLEENPLFGGGWSGRGMWR